MFLLFGGRRSATHRWLYPAIRVAALGLLVVATFVFHVSGTTLVELRIARIAIVVVITLIAASVARRRASSSNEAGPPRRLPPQKIGAPQTEDRTSSDEPVG
jgi:hypothetical protein